MSLVYIVVQKSFLTLTDLKKNNNKLTMREHIKC